ncbi:MAG: sugar kinase [Coriobacteriia bacterium]|nr:sugar kinase [Coriobacteriia bacterium]MBN2821770.1 sugar kinase [Coriobacteriia bacterium]
MSLLVVATYPVSGGPVLSGQVRSEGGVLHVGEIPVPESQGTSAMLGAACAVSDYLGTPAPHALIAGDIGRGDGTRAVYAKLIQTVQELQPGVVAFHYMQPVMALMRKAVCDLEGVSPQPLLVADAGGMYAAKAAGVADRFELMTPDVGEVGFLADPDVTHPAYVSHYLFGTKGFDPPELIRLASQKGGSARVLLVKGKMDHISTQGEVVGTVEHPDVSALEAIGGTGDTLTGLAAGFMAAGFPTVDAALCACRANRHAGLRMQATPAMRASDLVAALPEVFAEHLCGWGGACAAV